MTKRGLSVGAQHEQCSYRDGIFVYRTVVRKVGETTRGVIGLPVHAVIVSHLACDRCSAMVEAKDAGLLLTQICKRQMKGFTGPPDKVSCCPHCLSERGQLAEVYLRDELRDNFSVSARRYGTDCQLCLSCGRVVWKYSHGEIQDAALEQELENLFAVRK